MNPTQRYISINKKNEDLLPIYKSSNFICKTGLNFDIEKCREALQEITELYPFTKDRQQIGLTHRRGVIPSVEDATGSLFDFKKKIWLHREIDFCIFNEKFLSNYLHTIYQQIQILTKNKIGRVRLLNLEPKACYSFHRDPTIRYHLAIHTNEQCLIIFAKGYIFHVPADGQIYKMDAREPHTAMNGGPTSRIHLVFSEAEEF